MKIICWVCKRIIGYSSVDYEQEGHIIGECKECILKSKEKEKGQ